MGSLRRMLHGVVVAAVLMAAGCGANKVTDKEAEKDVKSEAKVATCTTRAQCEANDGKEVEIVGTYTVWDPLPDRKLDQAPAQQVMVVLDGEEEGPYLEAWGQAQHQRPLEEIRRFQGKKVRVRGTYLKTMPPHPTDPPHAASLAGACIHPVESIALAD